MPLMPDAAELAREDVDLRRALGLPDPCRPHLAWQYRPARAACAIGLFFGASCGYGFDRGPYDSNATEILASLGRAVRCGV